MNKKQAYSTLIKFTRVGVVGEVDRLIESLHNSPEVPSDVLGYIEQKVSDVKTFLCVSASKKLYENLSSTNIDEKCTALTSFLSRMSIENELGNTDTPKVVELLVDVDYIANSITDCIMKHEGYEEATRKSAEVVKYLIDSRDDLTVDDI